MTFYIPSEALAFGLGLVAGWVSLFALAYWHSSRKPKRPSGPRLP